LPASRWGEASPRESAARETDGPSARAIVVHYHIFKNAGTSLDWILKSAFGARWDSLEGDRPTSLLRPGDLSAFVRDRPDLCAVSSHVLRPPAPDGLRVLPVVLIREPLDRAFSVYSHHRRRDTNELAADIIAGQASFPEFVRWSLTHKSSGGMVIANYQVIHLSPASFRVRHIYEAVATKEDLRHAIAYLSGGVCFGTVDRFAIVTSKLRAMAGELNLEIPRMTANENVTGGRSNELPERLSIARAQLGHELYCRFRRENDLDYALYDWASGIEASTRSSRVRRAVELLRQRFV
jgi:hypothetical protein